MKCTNKRVLGILLCLAMVLAMLPMAVSAASPDTLYVKPNENWLNDAPRFAAYFFGNGEAWADCTDADGDGVYEVEVPDGFESVIFCRMNPESTENTWDNKWNQTSDLTVPTDAAICYVVEDGSWDNGNGQWVEYSADSGVGETEATEPRPVAYYVAGVEALCGVAWIENAEANQMTEVSDGVYSITYENVAAGDYEFKVTDGTWNNSWGADTENGNYALTVEKTSDVKITFTVADTSIAVDVTAKTEATEPEATEPEATEPEATEPEATEPEATEPEATEPEATEPEATEPEATEPEATEPEATEPEATEPEATEPEATEPEATEPVELSDYIVAGQAGLCGSEWDPADPANKMAVVSDGVFAITYKNVAAGTYEFKVTKGSWDENWGADGPNGSNCVVEVASVSDVTITFENTNNTIDVKVVPVDGEAPAPEATEPENEAPETDGADKQSDYYVAGQAGLCGSEWNPSDAANRMFVGKDGSCYITFKNVAPGEYQFKVTKGSWDENWGGTGPDGNYVVKVEVAGDVTVYFNPANGQISVKGAVDNNPSTGDMSVAGLVVALMAAAGTVAVIGKKKEF